MATATENLPPQSAPSPPVESSATRGDWIVLLWGLGCFLFILALGLLHFVVK